MDRSSLSHLICNKKTWSPFYVADDESDCIDEFLFDFNERESDYLNTIVNFKSTELESYVNLEQFVNPSPFLINGMSIIKNYY